MKRNLLVILVCVLSALFVISCDDKPHVHQFSSEWEHDDAYHWHKATCDDTEDVDSKGEHVWEYKSLDDKTKHTKTCKTCLYSVEEDHVLVYKTTEDKSKHYEECSHCGYKTEEGEHTFTASVAEDKTKHQETCTLCGYKKDAAVHNYGEWIIDNDSTEDEQGKKHRTCSVCNSTEDGVIELKEHTQHVWKTAYSSDAKKHWHDCVKNPKCTAKKEETDHILEYVKDEADGHYQKCFVCGYTTEKTAHSLKYKAAENGSAHYQECETCGYTTKETAHTYDIPNHDEKNHWKECVCGKHDTESAHTYTTGTVIKDGKAVEICSDVKAI